MKKFILLYGFLLFINIMNAQSVYNFETNNSPYQNLSGSTSLNNGVIWDDPGFTIPLGFNFNIASYTFDTVYILEWSIGGVVSSNPVDGDIIPIFPVIAQDIIDLGYSNGVSQSNISYKTEGTEGNRILKLEWNNVGFFYDSTESDFMNFQLWLYEGSNTIEYHYGPSSINNPTESFEGETGPLVSLGTSYNSFTGIMVDNGYFLSGDPTNPSIITLAAGDPVIITALQGMMPSGTVYRFVQQPLSISDYTTLNFDVYPNPVKDFLNLRYLTNIKSISIINELGQNIKQIPESRKQINVSDLHAGIYFIKIETVYGARVQKFVKQ